MILIALLVIFVLSFIFPIRSIDISIVIIAAICPPIYFFLFGSMAPNEVLGLTLIVAAITSAIEGMVIHAGFQIVQGDSNRRTSNSAYAVESADSTSVRTARP